jgi:hypothetical protein
MVLPRAMLLGGQHWRIAFLPEAEPPMQTLEVEAASIPQIREQALPFIIRVIMMDVLQD